MKKTAYLYPIILMIGITYWLQSCTIVPDKDYIHDYQNAERNSLSVASQAPASITLFKALYEHLDEPNLAKRINAAYASELYFNDTLHTHDSRESLLPYLVKTGEHLTEYNFVVTQTFQEGRDVFVKWTMDMTFDVMHKTIRSQSIGLSQLRFNADGKIIFHQDFWDSTEGLHKHMPYIGTWIKKVRNKL